LKSELILLKCSNVCNSVSDLEFFDLLSSDSYYIQVNR
jgi:hypothetical protein